MSGFDMGDDETYSEYKSRKLREKGPGFNVAMGQKRYNPDDPKKSEAAQRASKELNSLLPKRPTEAESKGAPDAIEIGSTLGPSIVRGSPANDHPPG